MDARRYCRSGRCSKNINFPLPKALLGSEQHRGRGEEDEVVLGAKCAAALAHSCCWPGHAAETVCRRPCSPVADAAALVRPPQSFLPAQIARCARGDLCTSGSQSSGVRSSPQVRRGVPSWGCGGTTTKDNRPPKTLGCARRGDRGRGLGRGRGRRWNRGEEWPSPLAIWTIRGCSVQIQRRERENGQRMDPWNGWDGSPLPHALLPWKLGG